MRSYINNCKAQPKIALWLLLCFGLGFFFAISTASLSVANEDNTQLATTVTSANFLISGMRDQFERLRKGIVRINGEMSEESLAANGNNSALAGPFQIFLAFDFDDHLLRFDRTRPRRYLPASKSNTKLAKDNASIEALRNGVMIESLRSVFCQTRECTIHTEEAEMEIQIHSLAAAPHEPIFDIRTIGLLDMRNYTRGIESDKIIQMLLKSTPNQVIDEGKGVFKIEWLLSKDRVIRRLWIDTTKGFAPIRFEVTDKRLSRFKPKDPNDEWPPNVLNKVDWTEINGTWVPINYYLESRMPSGISKFSHEFKWESVNEDLPKKLFTPEGLGCKPGTLVVNNQVHPPVIEKVIGFKDAEVAHILGGMEVQPNIDDPIAKPVFWKILFIVANIAFVLILAIILLRRRLRSSAG